MAAATSGHAAAAQVAVKYLMKEIEDLIAKTVMGHPV